MTWVDITKGILVAELITAGVGIVLAIVVGIIGLILNR